MASVGSIEYTVSVETQQSINAAKNFDASLDNVQRSAKKTDGEMGKLNLSMSKLAVSIGGVVSATALLNEFKRAVSVTKEFSVVISRLSSLTGLVGPELEQLSKQAREIGATSTLSASQAASAMQLIGSRAPQLLESADALGKVTQAAVVLAEAAGVDMVTAAGIMTSTMNQFNMSAEESDRIINTLAAGARNGAADVSSIAASLARAGTQADISGVSIEEFTGLVQALAKGEITASDAGTALRNVLLILDNAADKNLRPSLVGVGKALENLEKAQENGLDLLKLFGRENITAANILLRNREVYESVTEAVTGTSEAYDQQATNVDNLDGDIKGLSSAYEDLQIIVGQLADDQLRSLTQGLTQLLLYMGESEDGVSRFEKALEYAGMAASAIGAVLAGRVVMAMYAFTAAQIAATRAMTLGTIAANGLRVAMSLLGGPAGIVLLVATAIYQYTSRARDAKPATDDLADSLHVMSTAAERSTKMFEGLAKGVENLNKQELELRTDRVEKSLLRAQQNLKRYQRMFAGGHKTITTGMIEQQEAHITELTGQLERLRSRQGASDDGPATSSQSGKGAIKTLEDQLAATKLLGAARARLTALQKLGADATDEEREEVARLVTEIYNLEESQKSATKAAEDSAAAAKKSAEEQASGIEQNADTIAALEEQMRQAEMSAGELAQRQAELSLNEYATPQQIARVKELGAALRENAEAEEREKMRQAAVAADPRTEAANQYAEQLAAYKQYKEQELLTDLQYTELKNAAATEYEQARLAAQEEMFRAQSAGNEFLMGSIDALGAASTNVISGLLSGTMNTKEAMQALGNAIFQHAVGALVEMGVQHVKSLIMGQTAQAAAAGTAMATGAAVASAWAPAAAAVSLATLGANSAPAIAGITATYGATSAMSLVGARRQGGPVSPGSMYRVNEGGRPEVFQNNMGQQYMIPNERGKVVSNRDAQGGGEYAQPPIINVYNNDNTSTDVTTRRNDQGQDVVDIVVRNLLSDGEIREAVGMVTGTQYQGK